MKRMLFNATYQEELRVATVEGQKLINFDIETTSKTQRRGNIYKGVVTRVEPSLEACFVDYGTEKQGFLPFKEIDAGYLPENSRHRDFNRLPEGTELIIQVEKDERGNKGAALTTYVSLPGRYLVLMPNNSRSGGISRRIDGDERDELKNVLSSLNVPQGMSIIARTAALGRFPEELQWDLNYLLKLWDAIKTASSNHTGSFLIYQESNLVVRSIRDHFSPDITEILIDTDDVYEQAKQFMSHVMPNFVERVKLYSDDVPLFSRFQIEHQIESAYGRMVHLPSGGSIAIDHTEALTAIDVNSAKANKGSDIEATALATNMEAAEEIARQLRLRDLGGLVVVDFIDMESQKNQREVENCFKQQLGLDRARIQMGKLSKFGLLELSRQRLQASLEESTTIPCPRCAGVGAIRGTESTAVHVLRIIQEEAVKNAAFVSALHVQLPVPVATYLLNEKRDDVAKIEGRMKVKIVLIPNVHIDSPHYKIRKISSDNNESMSNRLSYNLVETPDDSLQYQTNENKSNGATKNNAMVKNITPSEPAPVMGEKIALRKIFGKFIGIFKPQLASTPDKKPAAVPAIEKPIQSNARNSANNRSNTNNPNNKVRPVGVNKSNNKIQTVRQNNRSNNSKPDNDEKYDNVIQNKPRNHDKPENATQNKSRNDYNEKVEVTTPNRIRPDGTEKYDNVIPNKAAYKAMANDKARQQQEVRQQRQAGEERSIVVQSTTTTLEVINQAWQQPVVTEQVVAKETPIITSASDVTPKAPESNDKAFETHNKKPILETKAQDPAIKETDSAIYLKTDPVVPLEVVNDKSPVKNDQVSEVETLIMKTETTVRENTITQAIDLGNFELVVTKAELVSATPELIQTPPVKRYNDVIVNTPIPTNHIEYQLIETKKE